MVRASYREGTGQVAERTEVNLDDEPLAGLVCPRGTDQVEAFSTATCPEEAAAMLVLLVGGDAAKVDQDGPEVWA